MKKIEDYLKHYIGCDVMLGGEKLQLKGICDAVDGDKKRVQLLRYDTQWYRSYKWADYDEIKLLLRPLSSMTEDEMYIILNELPNPYGQYIEDLGFIKPDAVLEDRSAPFLIYAVIPKLLSMGFDLFDLIDSGLVLDATKIEKV